MFSRPASNVKCRVKSGSWRGACRAELGCWSKITEFDKETSLGFVCV